ncbi:MAG: DegV family protein [Ardenticatenia bacterium]|nr:DegV family protein [Ardenticatenia bacterium]
MGVRIVTDSSSDIPKDVAEQLGITIVPLYIHFGKDVYREGVDITSTQFYKRLQAEVPNLPKTSAPSPGDFMKVYQPLLDEGHEIISVHLSAAFSGTYNSARLAAFGVGRDRVTVIDSRNVSMCLGWLAIEAAKAARRGKSRQEIIEMISDMIPRLRISSFLETLEFVKYSGRVSSTEAFLGTMLNIKPVLHIEGGKAIPLAKVRTREQALKTLADMAHELAPFQSLAIMHTRAPNVAEQLAERLGTFHPRHRIVIAEAGVAMASHVGPGAVGFCGVVAK